MRFKPEGGIVTRGGTRVARPIVQRAEALLRSLIGVSRAEVCFRPTGGVERVRLVADGGLSNGQIVQNVRSALLAALGVDLQPGQVEFVEPEVLPAPASTRDAGPADQARAAGADAESLPGSPDPGLPLPSPGVQPDGAGEAIALTAQDARVIPVPGNSLPRNGSGSRPPGEERRAGGASALNGGSTREGTNGNGHAARTERDPRSGGWPPRPHPQQLPARLSAPVPESTVPSAARAGCEAAGGGRPPVSGDAGPANAGVCLERIETLRQTGRLRCRVELSAHGHRYSAVADCTEQPLAELQLAARVTCDALRAGGLTQAHFEAATVANLGGVMHVLVALGGWNHGEPIRHSGSAVIRDSAEQAAALAVLNAVAGTQSADKQMTE